MNKEEITMKVLKEEPLRMQVEGTIIEEDPIFRESAAYDITFHDISYWNNKSNFSGNYNDLTNKPIIPVVPTNVSAFTNDAGYITKNVHDLTNYTLTNNLSNVALSGSYNDLFNKPTIPTKTSDLNNDSGFITNSVDDLTNYTLTSSLASVALSGSYSDLSNTPTLATVATSGSYSDLTNKPTIPTKTSDLQNDSGFITNSVNDLSNYTLSSNLASVATSGSYSDLSNTPTLATVATSGSYNDLTNKPTIPTKTSDLQNDSGFVTNTYSSSEVAIGKWIDNKTIYRKVYDGTTATSDVQINLASLNIAQIINIYGCAGSNGSFNPIPFVLVSGSTTYFISARIAYNILYLSNSSSYANKAFYLVIEYTKTS